MLKEYPLEGVKTKEVNLLPDERGFFAEAFRQDWKDLITEEIVQANLSFSYPGMIRAWHRHLRGQVDYFICIDGAVKICAYDDREDSMTAGELDEIILSDEKLQI